MIQPRARVAATGERGLRPTRRRRLMRMSPMVLLLLLASGCKVPNFGYPDPITPQGARILSLWKGSCVTALAVGVVTWGAILWAVFAYRKRNDEPPKQTHQHLGVEVLFTILPFVIVSALFYFTARDEVYVLKKSANPDVRIHVVGFRWNWQFIDEGSGVTETGRPGAPAVLWLPAHRTIQFRETSPDVIHSFWVRDFLFKLDVIPGRENKFEVTIDKTGTYTGRCAELCGIDHDRMLFTVKVVEPAEYDAHIKQMLAAGQTLASGTTSGSGS